MWNHSVRVDRRHCVGCTNCIKRCPTEAIRVQSAKANILDDRCVDCGACLSACPHGAMVTAMSSLAQMTNFEHCVAVPSPALYAQFKELWDTELISDALFSMGFEYVYEEARAAEIVAEATRDYLLSGGAITPVISSFCPVVVRLVQQEYPGLIDNLLPLEPPAEVAAKLARDTFCESAGASPESVGVFYISPCPARMTGAKSPLTKRKSDIDGVISILDVYGSIARFLSSGAKAKAPFETLHAGAYGFGTGMATGMGIATGTSRYLSVDGMWNVVRCLEELENDKFNDLLFLECSACVCGCVGGHLTFENPFVAKNRLRTLANSMPRHDFGSDEYIRLYKNESLVRNELPIEPKPARRLGENMIEAARNMDKMERVLSGLPGLDCGSCGSPSCRTLAEDIIKGNAIELDCIFKMRDKIRHMAQEMIELADAHKRG